MVAGKLGRRGAVVLAVALVVPAVYSGPQPRRTDEVAVPTPAAPVLPNSPRDEPSPTVEPALVLEWAGHTAEPPTVEMAPPPVETLMDRLTQIRSQKAEMDRQEQRAIGELHQRLRDQRERLKRLGIVTSAE
jgi:hypothetical protein